jgi:integrase
MKRRPITQAEFDAMVAEVVGEKGAGLWTFYLRGLWWSSLRLIESLELSWDSNSPFRVGFSQDRPMLKVPQELEKWNVDRQLPPAPKFAVFLLAVPEAERTGKVFKVKHASDHDLRRSFGERWAYLVEPLVLMQMMRHESIETTLRFYVGKNSQKTAEALWAAHEAKQVKVKVKPCKRKSARRRVG